MTNIHKKISSLLIGVFGAVLLLFLIITLFGSQLFKSSTVRPGKIAVKVRLKWLHQAQFAGMYVADKKGFYESVGLDVELLPFDYDHFPIDDVVGGKADFGVTGADELLIARENGAEIKALAVIYQNSPVVAYTFTDSEIKDPRDFVGKKLGVEKDINVEHQVRAMIEAVGVDYKDIIKVEILYDAKPLITGEVDVATGYAINESIQAENTGRDVTIFYPHKYGIRMYGDVLFTTEEMIENNPELVRSFVYATLQGWEYALKNREEAVNLTLLYEDPNNQYLNFDHQNKMLQVSGPLIKPGSGRFVGAMNYSNWRFTHQIMQKYDLLDESFDVEDAYTLNFL